MLFKSTLVAAALLGQSLAAPAYSIVINIDVQDGAVSHSPRTHHVQLLPASQIDLPVFTKNITVDEIKKDLKGLEKRANATAKAAGDAKKGDSASIQAVVNDLALQAYGFLNLVKSLNNSNPIGINETIEVDDAYYNMTSAILGELRAIVKANQTLCASSSLSSFNQNLDSLSSSFVEASDALSVLVPPCPEDDPRNPACSFHGDVETAKAIVPLDIDDTKDFLSGGAEGCPYKGSEVVVQELK